MPAADKLKTILIREISEKERKAIDVVKQATGLRHASKAVMAAVLSFSRIQKTIDHYKGENERLKRENRKLRECLKMMFEASEKAHQTMGEKIPPLSWTESKQKPND